MSSCSYPKVKLPTPQLEPTVHLPYEFTNGVGRLLRGNPFLRYRWVWIAILAIFLSVKLSMVSNGDLNTMNRIIGSASGYLLVQVLVVALQSLAVLTTVFVGWIAPVVVGKYWLSNRSRWQVYGVYLLLHSLATSMVMTVPYFITLMVVVPAMTAFAALYWHKLLKRPHGESNSLSNPSPKKWVARADILAKWLVRIGYSLIVVYSLVMVAVPSYWGIPHVIKTEKETVIGYLIEDHEFATTFMREDDRSLFVVPNHELVSLQVCAISPIADGRTAFIAGVTESKGATYPHCNPSTDGR